MHTNQFLSKNDENSQFLLISRRESNKVPAAGQQFCLSRPAVRKKHYDRERERTLRAKEEPKTSILKDPKTIPPRAKTNNNNNTPYVTENLRKKKLIKKSSKHRTKGRKESAARKKQITTTAATRSKQANKQSRLL
jgi:hypothetical protein